MTDRVDAADGTIDAAAERLVRGLLVAFPTETVYGLGADAADSGAVARIFAAKGRPSDHPLIVHIAADSDPRHWSRDVAPLTQRLIDRFWPGPLTLIVPRRDGVGTAAAAGQDSIGLRCPAHPLAQRLLSSMAALRGASRSTLSGVAAPSANRFGHVSPTRAEHVLDEFDGASTTDRNATIFVVDGGDCTVGIESTIVDCSRLATIGPVLLRPGSVTAAMLAEVIGAEPSAADRDAPRASGTLASHYAPATPLRLVEADDLREAPGDIVGYPHSMAVPSDRVGWLQAPRDATRYAHDLYAAIRALDARHAREIWVERLPATPDWAGIEDRLRRAAAS